MESIPTNPTKVVRIDDPRARRVADLALHAADLQFAANCLKLLIDEQPSDQKILREALWRSAIVHFMKCFGESGSRSSLNAKKVYQGDEVALTCFRYFQSLRNKHVAHDDNAYSQCVVGAALNKAGSDSKIAGIVSLVMSGVTLEAPNQRNLEVLITDALKWVSAQDEACKKLLAADLEKEPYETLCAMEVLRAQVPALEDLHRSRRRRGGAEGRGE